MAKELRYWIVQGMTGSLPDGTVLRYGDQIPSGADEATVAHYEAQGHIGPMLSTAHTKRTSEDATRLKGLVSEIEGLKGLVAERDSQLAKLMAEKRAADSYAEELLAELEAIKGGGKNGS